MGFSVPFRYFWAGQTAAKLADVLYTVAIVTIIYKATGSATHAAAVPFIRSVANLISGLTAPVVLESSRLHSVMVAAQAGQIAVLVPLIFLSDRIDSSLWVYGLLGFVFMLAFLEGWIVPARNAFIPRLVEQNKLVNANSVLSVTDQTVQMIAWGIGGIVVAEIGGESTLWLTLDLYFLSSLFLLFIKGKSKNYQITHKKVSKREAMKEGWVTIWRTPQLRIVTMMDLVEGVANGVWAGALLLVYVKEVLHKGEEWWGFLNSGYVLGLLLGGLLVLSFSRWVDQRLGMSMIAGSFVFSVLTVFFALTSSPVVALILCGLMGPAYQLRDISQRTVFQKHVDETVLPKVFSAQATILYTSFGLSVLLMGFVADVFGVRTAYLLAAGLFFVSAFLAVWKRKDLNF
ncbi:MFS transporter [Effusibacillus lacus]|uniref:MFS transporter n=1 Tax=Effusibacillus lacus TaxID=1348429 RepID=A0A292YSU6_9BACL|nr:MFS transporter [Effusibacillus lacus]TCS74880.1 MFS transporter [Effusibacillus lacus]GAX91555.1 MFS transporter [Effusibacillus lacus]